MKTNFVIFWYALGFFGATCSLMAEFKPPVLGHVPGSPGTLIRIDGIPGAAQVRASFDVGEAVEWIAISADQSYALAIRASDRAVIAIRLDREQPEPRPLIVPAGPDRIALSQNGAVAAIYSHDGASIQVVGGLPDHPVYQRTISTTALGNSVRSLAVSDDGSIVLASSGAESGELLVVTENGLDMVSLPASISAIVFRPKRLDAVILTAGRAYLATSLQERPVLKLLAGPEQGLVQPAAAEFSRDGRLMYIADPGARAIHILEPGITSAQTVPCDCAPSGLQRLHGQSVFWLNDPSTGLTRVLDGDNVAPRVLLVPHTAVSN